MKSVSASSLIKETLYAWMDDKALRLGAALAYYAIFSIPPLLVLVISSIGIFYDRGVSAVFQQQLSSLIGPEAGRTIVELSQQQSTSDGMLAGMLGILVLLFGASGVFGELQDAMDTIWKVQPKPGRGILGVIVDRFLSFAMVLGIGFLLLVSMILTSFVALVGGALAAWLPGGEVIGHLLELGMSFAVVTLLFAMMFKILPDVKIAWNDVWIGAAVTAALFTVGKFLIGLYLAKGGIGTSYGAAGSVIIMIVWVYYSSQILFLAAEFTKVYTNRRKPHVEPTENAEPKSEAA
jgi:membrane protein